jgi:uncharacterized protein YkwD
MRWFARILFPPMWALLALPLMAVMSPAPTWAQAPTAAALKQLEDQVFVLVNQRRAEVGLAPYARATELDAAARTHSLDMATTGYVGHTGTDGSAPVDRTRTAGYDSPYVGENAAAGAATAEGVMDLWMNEPPPAVHRANILKTDYKEIGISVVYQADSRYGYYWTQVFGARAGAPTRGGGTGTGATGTEPGTLQLTAVTSDGRLLHTIRYTNGTWSPFGDVKGQAGDRGSIVDAEVQAIGSGADSALHLCAITSDGRLWHTVRRADGSWLPFGDVASQAGDQGQFVSVALASVHGALHVSGVTSDGKLWHTVRRADGSWLPFGDVKQQSGDPAAFTRVAATMVPDVQTGAQQELYILAATADGRQYQTTRHANGAWSAFTLIYDHPSDIFVESGVTFTGSASGARLNSALVTASGQLWFLASDRAQVNMLESPLPVRRVALGPVPDASRLVHVAIITADGGLWHMTGSPEASWSGFANVKGVAGNPGALVSVSVDVVPG